MLLAAERLLQRDVCDLVILDQDGSASERAARLGISLDGAEIIDPRASELRAGFAEHLFELRRDRGMSLDMAHDAVGSVSMFGTMLVATGRVDGMVSGAAHHCRHDPSRTAGHSHPPGSPWCRVCSSCACATRC